MQAEGYPKSDQYSGFIGVMKLAKLYQDYVNINVEEAQHRYSARAGYSVNQTGLVLFLIGTEGRI